MKGKFDTYFPYRGPCGFCGGPDARHRLIDMLQGRRQVGESVAHIAADYELPRETVVSALRVRVGRRGELRR